MRVWRSAASFVAIISIVSCDDSLAGQENSLAQFVEKNQVGESSDYWLELYNLFGEWERVALVNGYYDDFSGCSDIATALSEKFQRQYRCMPAN